MTASPHAEKDFILVTIQCLDTGKLLSWDTSNNQPTLSSSTNGLNEIWVLSSRGEILSKSQELSLEVNSERHCILRRTNPFAQRWVLLNQSDCVSIQTHAGSNFLCHMRGEGSVLRCSHTAETCWDVKVVDDLDDLTNFTVKNFLYVRLTDWIGDMCPELGHLPLCHLCIPGTHDSATWTMVPGSHLAPDAPRMFRALHKMDLTGRVDRIMSNWGKAQSMSITHQLESGIRFLDVRTCLCEGELVTCHTLKGINIAIVFNQLLSFLEAHPREIVIIQMIHFYAMDQSHHRDLVEYIHNKLGRRLLPMTKCGSSITLSEMVDTGHQVIVIYQNPPAEFNRFLWTNSHKVFQSIWANKQDCKSLKEVLDDVVKQYQSSRAHDRFWVTQCVLTPNVKTVRDSLLKSIVPKRLKDFAEFLNPVVSQWLAHDWLDARMNIIIVDFFELGGFVEAVIHKNIRLAHREKQHRKIARQICNQDIELKSNNNTSDNNVATRSISVEICESDLQDDQNGGSS
eukprot:169645_1